MRTLVLLFLFSGCSFDAAVDKYCAGRFKGPCPPLEDLAPNGLDWVVPDGDALAGDCVPVRVYVASNSGFLMSPNHQGFPLEVSSDPSVSGLYATPACTVEVRKVTVNEQSGGADLFFKAQSLGTSYFGRFELHASYADAGLASPRKFLHSRAYVRATASQLGVASKTDGGAACVPGLPLTLVATDVNGDPARSNGTASVTLAVAGSSTSIGAHDGGVCTANVGPAVTFDWPYSANDRLDLSLNVATAGVSAGEVLVFTGPQLRSDGGIPIN